ncbi:alkaline phosphatase D family protein [Longibacter sp.]|jgi:alkaline phosphatase D|uniref:alkaline phosphatase D family protein n=1 Tax=Longibacter sp. TaxID=2045415 RepID=UPI003EB8F7EE
MDLSLSEHRLRSGPLCIALAVLLASVLTGCRYLDSPVTPDPISVPDSATLMWSGAVTPTSARVVAAASPSSGRVALEIDTTSSFETARTVAPDLPDATGGAEEAVEGVLQFLLTDLTPGTRYHYRLVERETVVNRPRGTFRTFKDGPQSYEVAIGGCAATGSRHAIFDSIRATSPDLFLHLGDMHYSDIAVPEMQRYRDAYATVHASPEQSRLFRSVPLAYVWDDHDFGPNNSSGAVRVQNVAQSAYRAFVPHYDLPAGAGGPIHQAFTVGRIRYILTDLRSARSRNDLPDTAEKSMMGEEQKRWFKAELRRARAYPVIVWVSSVPWIANDLDEPDRWSGFTTEREELAAYIDSIGVASRLVIVSGDAHMLALDDGTNNVYGPGDGLRAPVVQAAALDRRGSVKGGPFSIGPFPNRFSLRGANDGQYVRMEVDDDGADSVCITWTGRRWAYDRQRMTDLFAWEKCFEAEAPT